MGHGANAVSNLLMEGCGRKEHEYDKQTLWNANHRATECTVKTNEETKRGQRGHLERNVVEISTKKWKIIQRSYLVQHLPLWSMM